MQDTPRGSRLHIAIFGRRNAGKSSLINALTNQDIALVSNVPGTTTDPVYKAMEILPLGPVMLIDTAGIDDEGELGQKRVEKTLEVLSRTDLALLVMDANQEVSSFEQDLLQLIQERKIPVLGIANKADETADAEARSNFFTEQLQVPFIVVSAATKQGIEELKGKMIQSAPEHWEGSPVIGDLIQAGDTIVLVVPIDLAAPKGRLILPQVQTIRDILDHDAHCIVVKERELKQVLENFKKKPKLVVTDSQEFMKVSADTPKDVMLTSFSILFARHKGDLNTLVAGAKAIDSLNPGDKVLIAEGCTHHRQADDIGAVKIPRWLREYVGGELEVDHSSGLSFPKNITEYKLIVHCGSCMLNRREMLYRLSQARDAGVPIVNYGVLIAHLHGILKRALKPFPLAQMIYEDEVES